MRLKYCLLCDYATGDIGQKPILVGVFDRVHWRMPTEQPMMPPCFLVGAVEGSIAEGTDHHASIEVCDSNGNVVVDPAGGSFPLRLSSTGPGEPFLCNFRIQLVGMPLPAADDYDLWLRVNGQRIHEHPVRFAIIDSRA